MPKLFTAMLFGGCLFYWTAIPYAYQFKIDVKAGYIESEEHRHWSWEFSFEYQPCCQQCFLRSAFRLDQDSYTDLFYSDMNRWGLKWIPSLSRGPLVVRLGPGISLSANAQRQNQISLDLYGRLQYAWLFIEADNLFFKHGIFLKFLGGIEYPFTLAGNTLGLILGYGFFLTTGIDFSRLFSKLTLGVSYAF